MSSDPQNSSQLSLSTAQPVTDLDLVRTTQWRLPNPTPASLPLTSDLLPSTTLTQATQARTPNLKGEARSPPALVVWT